MTVKRNAVQITIPEIHIKRASLRIEGTSPLIVHRFGEEAKKMLLDKAMQKAKSGREAKNPVKEFIQSGYWITSPPTEFTEEAFEKAAANGAKFGFPATGVKQSAVSAAYRAGLTKDKVSVQGAFHIVGGELLEIQGTPVMREDYVIVANGAPDIRYRMEFPEWAIDFEIAYNSSVYSLEQIVTFFNFGGFACGLGNWRIEKGGIFGAYRIV